MPRWPKREEGMEQPKRARRRKPETAKANLEPPLNELRRTGCPPRGGIRRVCGEVPGRSRRGLPQRRTGRPKVGQGRARTMGAKAVGEDGWGETGSEMSKTGGVDSSISERPEHHRPRRLADWINPTGARKVHSLIDKV